MDIPTNDELFFTPYLYTMINELWRPGVRVRLLSVGLSQLEACDGEHNTQLELFEPDALHNVTTAACTKPTPLIADNEKRAHLLSATDALKDKFGEEAIRFGYELRNRGNTTGSSSKNPADYQ